MLTPVTRPDVDPAAVALAELAAGPRPALLDAALAGPTPALVFDLDALARRMRALAALARRHHVHTVFAVAACPPPVVVGLARRHLDGLLLSGPGELAHASGRLVVVALPGLVELDPGLGHDVEELLVACETPAQAARVARHRGAALLVRLAPAALVPGAGASRFGVGRDPADAGAHLRALAAAAPGRVRGVHVHHDGEPALSADALVRATAAAVTVARAAGIELTHVVIGGLHGVAIGDLELVLAALREAVPRGARVVVEAGRLLASQVGVATGRVLVARDHASGPLRVLDLSRICHLRGGAPRLLAPPDLAHVTFVGPTGLEADLLGRWTCAPTRFPEGARVAFAGITGDAIAWNTGHGGVGPARVELLRGAPRTPT